MNVTDERALRLLHAAGSLRPAPGKSTEWTIWYHSNRLDEARATHADWVRAFQAKYQNTERAAVKAVREHLDGKGGADTFEEALLGIVTCGEISSAITFTKEQSAKWHARLYDTRQKLDALTVAYRAALSAEVRDALVGGADRSAPKWEDVVDVDALSFLKFWIRGLDEKWAGDLRAKLRNLLMEWCVKYNVALAFKGLAGVSFDKQRNKWHARITVGGKQRRIGTYAKQGEACLAVLKHKAEVAAAAEDEPIRKPRKAAQSRKYIGVVDHPEKEGRASIVVSHADEKDIWAFLDATGQPSENYGAYSDHDCYYGDDGNPYDADYAKSGYVLGNYGTRQAAARGYDLFARRYRPRTRLNFPHFGELDAKGNVHTPLEQDQGQARAALQLFDKISDAGEQTEDTRERAKRGVLLLETSHKYSTEKRPEVFVGQEAAWVLSRFRWQEVPGHIAELFDQRPDFAELAHVVKLAGAGSAHPLLDIYGYFRDLDLARAVYDQRERNGGHAIWAENLRTPVNGLTYLSLEDAVYAAKTGTLPARGSVSHKGHDERDYSMIGESRVGKAA